MSDIRLFRLAAGTVTAIPSTTDAIEKSLQLLIERNLDEFLGVRFLASEYATTKSHSGRIDTLGIDETNNPVIVEYKRALNENVINQGLFYLNWLVDHRADFKLLVLEELGGEIANNIDWRYPRLVCIAGDFTKYDVQAIQQIPQNIDLIRYRRFGDDLILLEQVGRNTIAASSAAGKAAPKKEPKAKPQGSAEDDSQLFVLKRLSQSSQDVHDWWERLRAYALALGDGVEERIVGEYIAFQHVKNFAFFRFRPTLNRIVIGLALPPGHQPNLDGDFVVSRDKRGIEVHVDSIEDVKRFEPLLELSFQNT